MGEVYLAHDEKLDRGVALKVLPEKLLDSDKARSRFRREAHALSRLSHPHIASLLDFDSEDGIDFLVMELVAGPSLDESLRHGPMPERKLLGLGIQLTLALQAAHGQGIIHRDLKPSNLRLTPDGLLKVLDFGLARLRRDEEATTEQPTATQTAPGSIVGTPPYMAPEQLLADSSVDARTDIYATGVVLYELATGQRPFGTRSGVALTDAILHAPPVPPRSVVAELSADLEGVVLKALEKDPDLRHQTAQDLRADLERVLRKRDSLAPGSRASAPVAPSGDSGETEDRAAHQPASRTTRRLRPTIWFLAAAALGAVVLAGVQLLRPPPPPRITDVRPLGLDVGPAFLAPLPSWATDGVRLYYVVQEEGRFHLLHVALAGGEPSEIPTPFDGGLQLFGYLRRESALLAWGRSPEETDSGNRLWLIPLPTGTPRPLGGLSAGFVAISPDESKLALTRFEGDGARIVVVSLDDPGSPPLVEHRLSNDGGYRPVWSPDGSRLRFTAPLPDGGWQDPWVWEASLRPEAPRPLWPGWSSGWSVDGRHFFLERAPSVFGGRYDVYGVSEPPWRAAASSEPVPLTQGPVSFHMVRARPDGRGLLGYGSIARGELRRYDRQTRRFERVFRGESIGMVRPSPDGQWLAWVACPEGTLYRSRRDGSERLRLTSPGGWAYLPAWSPDSSRIAYVGLDPGDTGFSIRVIGADGGTSDVVARPEVGHDFWNPCWLTDGDGDSLLFSNRRLPTGIQRLDLSSGTISPLEGGADLTYPICGPEGRVLATRVPADRASTATFVARRPDSNGWEEVGAARMTYPTWTRDGRSFCGLSEEGHRIECYSFSTRHFETLAELGEDALLTWLHTPWFGLDADDNPLVMFDHSTRDLYALDWETP